jgi:hypothetical protein
MPVQVELIKDNRVVVQTYSDPLTNTHMYQLRDKMDREILPAAANKVHIIADFSGVRVLPGTILTTGSSMLIGARHDTGVIIAVTQNNFVRSMARVFSHLSPHHTFKIVSSLDEAHMEIDRLLAQET